MNSHLAIDYFQQNTIYCDREVALGYLEDILQSPDSYTILKSEVHPGVLVIDMMYYALNKDEVYNKMVEINHCDMETKKLVLFYESGEESNNAEAIFRAISRGGKPLDVFINTTILSKYYDINNMSVVKRVMCNMTLHCW